MLLLLQLSTKVFKYFVCILSEMELEKASTLTIGQRLRELKREREWKKQCKKQEMKEKELCT
jgi:hypothetical protein